MKSRTDRGWVALAVVLLAMVVLALPAAGAPDRDAPGAIASEQIGGTVLGLTPHGDYSTALLRVSGPNGYRLTKAFGRGVSVAVDLMTEVPDATNDADSERTQVPLLSDGGYRYELILTDDSSLSRVHTGHFTVQGGQLVAGVSVAGARAGDDRPNRPTAPERYDGQPASVPESESVTDWLQVADDVNDGETEFSLDSDGTTSDLHWDLRNSQGDLFFEEDDGGFLGAGTVRVTFDRGGNVGIGTTSPQQELTITESVEPNVRLENTSTGISFNIEVDETPTGLTNTAFQIEDNSQNEPFQIENGAPTNSLVVNSFGQVGIGTTTPAAPLGIAPPTGNAAFRLAVSGAETWAISNTGSIVTFNLIGSGGQETTFRERNDASGFPTFEVQGTAKATQHINSSSRALKTDFSALDGRDVLAKLAAMPVSSWRYKVDDPATRHYGPVAEDFQATFGLGDGKTISTVDAQGVALAAIQGLNASLAERDQRIADLEARLAQLERLLNDKIEP